MTLNQRSQLELSERRGVCNGVLVETGAGARLRLADLIARTVAGDPLHLAAKLSAEETRSFFDWSDLKSVAIEQPGDSSHWHFYKKGHRIDPVLLKLVDGDGRPSAPSIELLLSQSGTIRLDRVDLRSDPIRTIANRIKELTGARVRAVAMGSGGPVHGMPKHYDPVDVIAIQTVGKKNWELFGRPGAGCGVFRELDKQPNELSASIELAEGDILFVPAGLHHRCVARNPSLHIAFTLKWPTLMDVRCESPEESEALRAMEPLRFFGSEERLVQMVIQADRALRRPMPPDHLVKGVQAWLNRRDNDAQIEPRDNRPASAVGFAG